MGENYKLAITTRRSSAYLSRAHGFESVEALAAHLPPEAACLDIGSGVSTLGVDVARLRPDISWVNLDYGFYDPRILAEANLNVPENVVNLPGDATQPTFEPDRFDAVFSYWLFPHLSAEQDEPARVAAAHAYQATKEGGEFRIGPKVAGTRSIRALTTLLPSYVAQKNGVSRQEDFADEVVAVTKLEPLAASITRIGDIVGEPFFGTSRFVMNVDGQEMIMHPKSGEYVPVKSVKGASTIIQFAARMAAERLRN